MDHAAFDRIARLLGGAASRRSGIRAALGAVVGLGVSEALASGRGIPEDPSAAGPCGSSPEKNRCTKDSECCTGYCKLEDSKSGRCRCAPENTRCTKTTTCCRGFSCRNGRCKPDPRKTGQSCTRADTCEDRAASCTAYSSGDPAGTYCLLPGGKACSRSGDCFVQDCVSGVCGSCSDPARCAAPCVPTVCPTCANQTITAALLKAKDGDTIVIGPGTYVESLIVPVNVTLRACKRDTVILKNAASGRTILVGTGKSLTLVNIAVDANATPGSVEGGGINGDSRLTTWGKTVVRNSWTAGKGGGLEFNEASAVVTLNDDTIIELNRAAQFGGGASITNGSLVLNDSATIRNNDADSYAGGVLVDGSTLTMNDASSITGNQATTAGGGIYSMNNSSITIKDKATVTANQAGGLVCNDGTLTGLAAITGNTPVNCSGACCP